MTDDDRSAALARIAEKVRQAGPWPTSLLASATGFRRHCPPLHAPQVFWCCPPAPLHDWDVVRLPHVRPVERRR